MFAQRIKKLFRDKSGGVSILVGGGMLALLGCSALAIDFGSVYMNSRRLQGVADAAALAAANNLADPNTAANGVITANNWGGTVQLQIVKGIYSASQAIAPNLRFTANNVSPDSARVTLTAQSPVYFSKIFLGRNTIEITRVATASRAKLASFSIGSRLAAVNGGIAGQYLSQLTGTNLNLSVADYNQLLSANVDLLQFSDALATRINAQGLSYSDVLETNVTTPQVLGALGDALVKNGEASAANVVVRMAQQVTAKTLKVGTLVDLGPYGKQSSVSSAAKVNANGFDLTQAVLQLASGQRQVSLDLAATVPGLIGTKVKIGIGERPNNSPWLTVTDNGTTIIRTAQIRIFIEAGINAIGLASLKVPVLVEMASAEAKLTEIDCGNGPTDNKLKLSVKPSVGSLLIGKYTQSDFEDFTKPLTLQPEVIATTLGLVNITGSSRSDIGSLTWKPVTFNATEIAARTKKTVYTDDIITGTLLTTLGNLNLKTKVLFIEVPLGQPLLGTVTNALGVIGPPLDGLLNTVMGLVGARLGEADVWPNGVRCGIPALIA